jgi:quercetin dioxygenase-like cupin family protein
VTWQAAGQGALWGVIEPVSEVSSAEQIVYIRDGVCDFHIGDEVIRPGKGGVVVVAPNVEHYADVVGDQPVLNLEVFTPSRSEYG